MSPRRCLLESIQEIFEAAEYLSEAADAHLAGQRERADALILKADIPAIAKWTEAIWGRRNQDIFGVNFGGGAQRWDADGARPLYANKRAEMWSSVKDWLEQGALPDDPELRADLLGVEYGFNAKGEIQLEKKDDMKKRGLASSDIADALALTFALPVGGFAWDLPPVQAYCVTEYDLSPSLTTTTGTRRTNTTHRKQ